MLERGSKKLFLASDTSCARKVYRKFTGRGKGKRLQRKSETIMNPGCPNLDKHNTIHAAKQHILSTSVTHNHIGLYLTSVSS